LGVGLNFVQRFWFGRVLLVDLLRMANILKDETYARKRGGQSLRRSREHGGGYVGKAVGDAIWARTDLEDCCVPNTMRTRGKALFIDLNGNHKTSSPIKELE
jgi:hypothetical protein